MVAHVYSLRFLPLRLIFDATQLFLGPFYSCLNLCFLPFVPTSKERKTMFVYSMDLISSLMALAGIFVLFVPACLAFLLRSILHQLRWPYEVLDGRHLRPWLDPSFLTSKNKLYPLEAEIEEVDLENSSQFSVATVNICLCPDVISQINNLPQTSKRAKEIGERIVVDQLYYNSMIKSQQLSGSTHSGPQLNRPLRTNVLEHFPCLDFICFQEVFDHKASQSLIAELQKVYPWVIHDVGINSPRSNFCSFNSGLLLASRYEIVDVDFKRFSRSCGTCRFLSKGLLMTKILVKRLNDNECLVGYVFVSHLQAFQGKSNIVSTQLEEIQQWTSQFRSSMNQSGDRVLFDVLCGDFNIDNMSPGDVDGQNHPIFTEYLDVCRVRPGRDQTWAIGTEFRVSKVHDSAVASPAGLREVLQNPLLRPQYILDADLQSSTMEAIYRTKCKLDSEGNPVVSPSSGNRRVDFVLYRADCEMTVNSYDFISRLASLTDHIPVSMTFTCPS